MDFMKLKATLSLDSSEYEQGLDKAEGKTGKLKKGLATFGKVSAVAIGAAAAATAVLVKKSVQAYAEYEQLAGGVNKLFGDEASKQVMQYAENAYKTAGMSASQYMEQATSFSAALINSLGGDQMAAAKQTDVAMRAISDNFNTFGGDISNVQNAFQGFAKQNYTMLDNLKLGYGGTKTEMERLIADANEWAVENGKAADLSIDSFSDVVTAIDYIQQKQGIAGTTAAEASKTIEGSVNMVKAAWDNLVTGFADPKADIGALAKNVIESAGTAAKNIAPAVMQALKGIGQAIAEFAPQLINSGVQAIVKFAEGFGKGAPSVMSSMADTISVILQTIANNLPAIIKAAFRIALGIAEGLIKALPKIVVTVARIGAQIVRGLGSAIWGKVTAAANGIKDRFMAPIESLKAKIQAAVEKIKSLFSFKITPPHIPLPHFSISGKFSINPPSIPSVGVKWYKKAQDTPYLFSNSTLFGAGEGSKDEMLYGRTSLMKDIKEATSSDGGDININLNYDANADATEMLKDIARGVQRYRMAGAI